MRTHGSLLAVLEGPIVYLDPLFLYLEPPSRMIILYGRGCIVIERGEEYGQTLWRAPGRRPSSWSAPRAAPSSPPRTPSPRPSLGLGLASPAAQGLLWLLDADHGGAGHWRSRPAVPIVLVLRSLIQLSKTSRDKWQTKSSSRQTAEATRLVASFLHQLLHTSYWQNIQQMNCSHKMRSYNQKAADRSLTFHCLVICISDQIHRTFGQAQLIHIPRRAGSAISFLFLLIILLRRSRCAPPVPQKTLGCCRHRRLPCRR